MSAAEKKTAFRIATVLGMMHALANNSNSTKSDIAQKLKQGNIFWKIPMKIPVNMHYYSLVTENVDSMCQTKTAGRGEAARESIRPGDLGGGGPPSRPNRGKSASSSLGG